MKVIRCQNSHFYDADKYNACPVCGAAPIGEEGKKKTSGSESHFWGGKKETTVSSQQPNPFFNPEIQPQQPVNNAAKIDKTQGMFGEPDVKENDYEEFKIQVNKEFDEPFTDVPVSQPAARASEKPVREEKPVQPQQTARVASLEEQIRNASADSGDKTVGYFSSGNSAQPQSPAGVGVGQVVQAQPSGEPVVGWLVCVKGKHFGEPFAISAGRNSVGRMPTNKVVLSKDNTVSREKHVWITYEPKRREFFIQPGESSGLAYLNDENIMETRKLTDRDMVEIGDGKYMFVALCDSSFSWEDFIGKE